jgi:hypothetical protein
MGGRFSGGKHMEMSYFLKQILLSIFVLSFIVGVNPSAFAEDELPAESKAKLDESIKKTNIVPGASEVDDLITNNNLRALSGSLSRWSIASQLNYNGGTIEEPLSQDRPNISGGSGNTIKSDLDGAISAKYNISGTTSILAGIGVRWIAPLSTGSVNNYKGTTIDAMNPYLTYQHVYKWLGIQSVLQIQGMQWTQSDYTALGYAEQLSFDQENVYEMGRSGLSAGISVAGQYQWFNKSGAYGSPSDSSYVADLSTAQSVYAFTFAPLLEYQLSKKFNLRTLVNVFTYEHYASASTPTDLIHDSIYESVGVGVSVTRDIFLYPNVQFLPGNMMSSLTNIGLAATINVF